MTENTAATKTEPTSPPQDTPLVQGALASRTATADDLMNKRARRHEFPIQIVDADGHSVERIIKYVAISSTEYDALVAKHKPTTQQKQQGAAYNVDTFAPALIAAVSCEPKLTVEQATAIYNSPQWSGGEISALFIEALKLCNAGFDVPFTAAD